MKWDIETERAFDTWMRRTREAAAHLCRDGEVYNGEEGCRRFARECGPAIYDFGEYGEKNISSTYSGICVIAYRLRPPVSAGQWFAWIREGYAEYKVLSERNMKMESEEDERKEK